MWKERVAIKPYGKMVRGKFVHVDDDEALAGWLKPHKNTDSFISVATYTEPHRQSSYLSELYLEVARQEKGREIWYDKYDM